MHLKALSSSSFLISIIPTLKANGAYISNVSCDFIICLCLGIKSIVLMLCTLSHNLTNITLTSLAMAKAIFWKLFALVSALFCIFIFPSLLTPSTMFATSDPKFFSRTVFGTSQSSMTSCIKAAQIESGSI